MKKVILALFVLFLIPTTVLAWDDCPLGEVFCEGKCGLFVDTDNDGICDRSQPAPENRNNTGAAQINIPEPAESRNKQSERVYHLLPISILLVVLYVISRTLSKKNILSVANHRKIWNTLLLITFLISGILGILLVIRINFGTVVPLPFDILFWHVEAGIAMFAISVFHTLWHWAYFKSLFGIKK